MTWPHIHTILNHFPVVLTIVGMVAALLGLVWPRRALWLYSVVSLTLAGVTAYPAWQSGEEAAETVRRAWYIAPGAIKRHAEVADSTLWVLLAVGVIAAFVWWRLSRSPATETPAVWLRVLVLAGSIASFGAVTYAAWLGGAIVVNSPILASPVPPAPVPDTVRDTVRLPLPVTAPRPGAPRTR